MFNLAPMRTQLIPILLRQSNPQATVIHPLEANRSFSHHHLDGPAGWETTEHAACPYSLMSSHCPVHQSCTRLAAQKRGCMSQAVSSRKF